jgi:hypothetical protein
MKNSRKINRFDLKGDENMKVIPGTLLINTTANQAIIYKNRVRYSGLINRQTTMYFLPKSMKPIMRMIQKEKAKLVSTISGLSK